MADFKALLSEIEKDNNAYCFELPSRKDTELFADDLFQFLFPIVSCGTRKQTLSESELELKQLMLRFQGLLCPLRQHLGKPIELLAEMVFEQLPKVYKSLRQDAEAILMFDPAAYSLEEIIISYPGFFSTYIYRFSHQLYKYEIPILPRLMSEYAHSKTGIDIHPGAQIGDSFFIDHGTGIVIGETCVIGNNVKIYQSVTLGAISVEKTLAATKRHPTIEDDVIIYSGSTILGGETTIGHNSIIGGNSWVTKSVPPYSIVYHKSEVKVRKSKNEPPTDDTNNEPINFVI